MKKENIIDIITDEDGRKIVVITDIRFKGKRNIDWEDVENYLKEYVGKCYEVVETADQVFIGNDFPEELKGSEDTKRLCGANAKTKANATQKIPTLLKCATNKRWQENFKGKGHTESFVSYVYNATFLPQFKDDFWNFLCAFNKKYKIVEKLFDVAEKYYNVTLKIDRYWMMTVDEKGKIKKSTLNIKKK